MVVEGRYPLNASQEVEGDLNAADQSFKSDQCAFTGMMPCHQYHNYNSNNLYSAIQNCTGLQQVQGNALQAMTDALAKHIISLRGRMLYK